MLISRHKMAAVLLAALGVCNLAAAQGTTTTVALEGHALPDGTTFMQDINPFIQLNDAGEIAFNVSVTGGASAMAIVRGDGTQITEIARTGQLVPGSNAPVAGFGLSLAGLNNVGDVALMADLTDGSRGIYTSNGLQFNEVAKSGNALPPTVPPQVSGLTYGTVEMAIGDNVINDSGQVVYRGTINGLPFLQDDALFLSNPNGATRIVAHEGSAAKNGDAFEGVYEHFNVHGLFDQVAATVNNAGETAFHAATRSPQGFGTFWNSGSSFVGSRSAGRSGQTDIPGAPGTMQLVPLTGNILGDPSDLTMNDHGEIAFQAQLNELPNGPPNDTAIYRFSPQGAIQTGGHGLTEISRLGRPSPDGEGMLGRPSSIGFQINNHGDVAFTQQIISQALGNFDGAVMLGDGQDLQILARIVDFTPDGERRFSKFSEVAINESKQVAFSASLIDANANLAGQGIYLTDGIETIEVIREGRPLAGGTVDGLTFQAGEGLNELGQVAYGANIAGARDGVFLFAVEDLKWRGPASGEWADNSNWTLSYTPGKIHNVSIDTAANVLGPAFDTAVRSVHVGSTTSGIAQLRLQPTSTLSVDGSLTIADRGRLSGSGSINGALMVEQGGEVRIEIDEVSDFDQFDFSEDVILGGRLAISTSTPADSYEDPTTPGQVDTFELIRAMIVTGQFDEVVYDDDLLVPTFGPGSDGSFMTHVGNGLFRSIEYSADSVQFSNYAALLGDANGDGVVDGEDFIIWNENKFTAGTDWLTGDFNGDGVTDGQDFILWNDNKFTGVNNTAAVPEPTAYLMLVVGLLAADWRRR